MIAGPGLPATAETVFRAVAAAADALYVADVAGRIAFLYPAALKILGYRDAGELLGRSSHETIHYLRPDGSLFPAAECALLRPSQTGGYLLKDSVANLDHLTDALTRISEGGTVFDPKLVAELLGRTRRTDPLDALTPREREVIKLMAEGQSNAGIAKTLWITQGAVEKHIKHIFSKLGIPATSDTHRRVLAVITFLDAR